MPAPDAGPRARFRADRSGAVAVEFAILAWPLILLILGILQLGLFQYTQVQLSNVLFDSAADPEPSILVADAASYKTVVCNRIRTMPLATCRGKILVEMQRLGDVPTAASAIQGLTFTSGSPNDVLLLRAGLTGPRFLPFMPMMMAKASVVFRR